RSVGRSWLSIAWKLGGALLVTGLLAWNGWWYWRDTRPVADLRTISDWIARGQTVKAESALREHLRRSPRDGEVRMMLARVLATRGDLVGCAGQLHEVPYWWPDKFEALHREGQSYLMADRAKDAEHAWLTLIKDDPLHAVSSDLFHDACQEL